VASAASVVGSSGGAAWQPVHEQYEFLHSFVIRPFAGLETARSCSSRTGNTSRLFSQSLRLEVDLQIP